MKTANSFLVVLTFIFILCIITWCTFRDFELSEPLETDKSITAECCPVGCIQCPDPEPDPDPDLPGHIQEVLDYMNQYRASVGAPAVTIDDKLTCAAEAHSNDIGSRKVCSHYGSDGSTPWDRARRCGTSANGEIVACGHRTGRDAVIGWYNSTGHRNIMLNRNYKKVGIGMYNYYWTALFSY